MERAGILRKRHAEDTRKGVPTRERVCTSDKGSGVRGQEDLGRMVGWRYLGVRVVWLWAWPRVGE